MIEQVFFGPHNITNRLITANKHAFAIPAYMPIVPGHSLVCPRRTVATIEQLSSEELSALLTMVTDIKKALGNASMLKGLTTHGIKEQ